MEKNFLKQSDVFISYGRAESKNFATKLHNRLKEKGFEVWFDQNDIPLGVDFQSQIDDGIEKAANFIYIIAPHSINSEYCLKEVLLAIKRNKRIIPILHVEPSTKEVWDKLHPTIGKLNWVYMREKFDKGIPQNQWEAIDDFEKSFVGFVDLLELHKPYVLKHAEILTYALEWERNKKSADLLLHGEDRSEAEKWLVTTFDKSQPPCHPTDLHCEYICESKKNSSHGVTDTFLCYAREETGVREVIKHFLHRHNITTWTDTTDIKTGMNFEEAIRQGILQADNFLYLISPNSIKSQYCLDELKLAVKYNKRIITVLAAPTADDQLPERLRTIQYVNFSVQDEAVYLEQFGRLLNFIHKEADYYHLHKLLLVKALKWEENGEKPTDLLHGFDLENAVEWLEKNKTRKEYKPTTLQVRFINESKTSRISVFISYGRKHSKDFATQLYDRLNETGFNVWFDQNDIPLGVDFQNQIDAGIENSDNFVFIISPHSVKSVFCLKEIVLAVSLNKRIIPLLHVEPSDCWDKMHPTIEKLNWIYFQEGKNDFEESFKGLVTLMRSNSDYVKRHTLLLDNALTWQRNKKMPHYLLSGKARIDAEEWLFTKFTSEQAPCLPTNLHCELITESKKAANLNMTEVFFSYAREDAEMMQQIRTALIRNGFSNWADTSDLKTGSDFAEVINEGIELTDNFIFLISPYSVASEYCISELDYAVKLNKRIIPLYIKDTDAKFIPEIIKKTQYLDFKEDKTPVEEGLRKEKTKFEKDIDELVARLRADAEYFRVHKQLLSQAIRWEKQKKNPGILLRGFQLAQIEGWLNTARKRSANKPIDMHEEFVAESNKMEKELTPEVFISYHVYDADFVHRLSSELQNHGKIVWVDQAYIDSGSNFEHEIDHGIENSHNFVFLLSELTAKSPENLRQLNKAIEFNKRIISVEYQSVDEDEFPEALKQLPTIDMRLGVSDFSSSLSELLRNLDTDKEHVKQHTKILKAANDWKNNRKSGDLLLRGSEFEIAKVWMDDAIEQKKSPKVTDLQRSFLDASLKAIRFRARVKRIVFIVMIVLTILAISLGIVANQQAIIAKQNEKEAIANKEEAVQNAIIAKKNEKEAIANKEIAQKKEKEAIANKEEAVANALRAERNAKIAKENELEAIANRKIAEANEKTAKENAIKATLKGLISELNREQAKFGEYKSKARELAVQSLAQQDGSKLKALLGMLGYKLNLYAYSKLKQSADNVYSKFDKSTIGVYDDAQNVENLYRSLVKLSSQIDEPTEVFSALHDAYVSKSPNRDIAFKGAESWAFSTLSSNEIVFNNNNGNLVVSSLTSDTQAIPVLNVTKNLTEGRMIQANTFSFAGNGMYCGTMGGQILYWDTNSWGKDKEIVLNSSMIQSSSFSKNKNMLYFIVKNTLYSISENSGQQKVLDSNLSSGITKMTMLEDATDTYIVVATESGEIYYCNLSQPEYVKLNTTFAKSGIKSIVYNSSKKILATGNDNGQIILFAPFDISALKSNAKINNYPIAKRHNGVVRKIEFSPNGKYLASGSFDQRIMMWNIEGKSASEIAQLSPLVNLSNDYKILSLVFDRKSDYIIFSDEKNIKIIPTKAEAYFKSLCAKNNDVLTEEEWEKYVGSILNVNEIKPCE